MPAKAFERNCFVNCPFDDAYQPLLRALLFLLLGCGFQPRIASATGDSGEVRVNKIRKLIRQSRYSIHDISRIEARKKGDLPRFNMPFELGLDLGHRYANQRSKRCLILEREKHRYQAALSDIGGQDIRAHGDEPEELIHQVRSWLVPLVRRSLPPKGLVWLRFNEFTAWLEIDLAGKGYDPDDIERLEPTELMRHMRRWLKASGGLKPG